MTQNLISFVGMFVFIGIAWAFSENRKIFHPGRSTLGLGQ